ncbi:hypothetical protein L3Q82_016389, partial [Scortum barcoo]
MTELGLWLRVWGATRDGPMRRQDSYDGRGRGGRRTTGAGEGRQGAGGGETGGSGETGGASQLPVFLFPSESCCSTPSRRFNSHRRVLTLYNPWLYSFSLGSRLVCQPGLRVTCLSGTAPCCSPVCLSAHLSCLSVCSLSVCHPLTAQGTTPTASAWASSESVPVCLCSPVCLLTVCLSVCVYNPYSFSLGFKSHLSVCSPVCLLTCLCHPPVCLYNPYSFSLGFKSHLSVCTCLSAHLSVCLYNPYSFSLGSRVSHCLSVSAHSVCLLIQQPLQLVCCHLSVWSPASSFSLGFKSHLSVCTCLSVCSPVCLPVCLLTCLYNPYSFSLGFKTSAWASRVSTCLSAHLSVVCHCLYNPYSFSLGFKSQSVTCLSAHLSVTCLYNPYSFSLPRLQDFSLGFKSQSLPRLLTCLSVTPTSFSLGSAELYLSLLTCLSAPVCLYNPYSFSLGFKSQYLSVCSPVCLLTCLYNPYSFSPASASRVSTCLSAHLSVCSPVCLYNPYSFSLGFKSQYLSVCSPVCLLTVCLSVQPLQLSSLGFKSQSLSVCSHLSVCSPVCTTPTASAWASRVSTCLSAHLSVCVHHCPLLAEEEITACLSVCLSACLSLQCCVQLPLSEWWRQRAAPTKSCVD